MSEYQRKSRTCSIDQMLPELASAIRAHIEKYELGAPGELEAEAILCCQTESTREKRRFWQWLSRGDKVIRSGVLLTPRWIVWATSGDRTGIGASSARLEEIEVREFKSELVDDHGLTLFGDFTDTAQRVQAFLAMGEDEAGEQLKNALKEAVQRARE